MAYKNLFMKTEKNAEIATSGKAIFAQNTATQEAINKHGSLNTFLITSISANEMEVRLNDDTGRLVFRLKGSGTVGLKAEQGIMFNFLSIVNLDAGVVVTAEDVTVLYGKSLEV